MPLSRLPSTSGMNSYSEVRIPSQHLFDGFVSGHLRGIEDVRPFRRHQRGHGALGVARVAGLQIRQQYRPY